MNDDWFYRGVWKWQIEPTDAAFIDGRYQRTIDSLAAKLKRSRFRNSPAAYRTDFSNCARAMIAAGKSDEFEGLFADFVAALTAKRLHDTESMLLLGLCQLLCGRTDSGIRTWRDASKAPYSNRMGFEVSFVGYLATTVLGRTGFSWKKELSSLTKDDDTSAEPVGYALARLVLGHVDASTAIAALRDELKQSKPEFTEGKWLVRFYSEIKRYEQGVITLTVLKNRIRTLGNVKLLTVPFEYVIARVFGDLMARVPTLK